MIQRGPFNFLWYAGLFMILLLFKGIIGCSMSHLILDDRTISSPLAFVLVVDVVAPFDVHMDS